MEPTQAYLKQRLHYEPTTGVLTWHAYNGPGSRTGVWNSRWAGKPAGCSYVRSDGRVVTLLSLDSRRYYTYRVIWCYMTGAWPTMEIDHINHDPGDNRWSNLREVDGTGNMRNTPKRADSTSGVMGVSWFKRDGNWRVYISVGGRQIHGGYFDDFEEAVARRKELEAKYGFHTNHGAEKLAA